MVNRIEELKLNMSFKELEYLKTDLDCKSELMSELEIEFTKSISKYLESNIELKNKYDTVLKNEFNDIINKQQENDIINDEDEHLNDAINNDLDNNQENLETPDKDPLIKDLYRKIVKKTHPDKIKDTIKNELYLDATDSYDINDIFSLYLICSKLDIQYNIRPIDAEKMNTVIKKYNTEIKLIESTFPWQWYETSDDKTKHKFIEAFIIQRIH